jgi:hypothetical protein
LILGDRKLGDLDLAPEIEDLQSGFEYRGGYGFSLGEVIVPLDERGIIVISESGIASDVGGGFELAGSEQALRLENLPAPF